MSWSSSRTLFKALRSFSGGTGWIWARPNSSSIRLLMPAWVRVFPAIELLDAGDHGHVLLAEDLLAAPRQPRAEEREILLPGGQRGRVDTRHPADLVDLINELASFVLGLAFHGRQEANSSIFRGFGQGAAGAPGGPGPDPDMI